MYSANYKRYAILEKLVAKGADLLFRDNAGRDIYHYCSQDDPKVREAIDRGVAMRAQGGQGYGMADYQNQGLQYQQQQGQYFNQAGVPQGQQQQQQQQQQQPNVGNPAANYPRNGFGGTYGNVQQQAAEAGAYANPQQGQQQLAYGASQQPQQAGYQNAAAPAYGAAQQQQYYGR